MGALVALSGLTLSVGAATASAASTSFGTGTWAVGSQIAPGTYRTAGGPTCYWARLRNFGGTLTAILANALPQGQSIVTILPTDAGFESDGCGTWSPLPASGTPASSFGSGNWAVGITIEPGTYDAPGGTSCYWARESGFTGTLTSIIANTLPVGPAVVTILATDKGFESDGCGTWTLQAAPPPPPTPTFSTYTRVYGATADATAASELEHQFPAGACPGNAGDRPVVLATDATYPDALASAYLARSLGTGTLLTQSSTLSGPTLAAIKAEGITTVDVVGGPLAVTTAVVAQLEATDATACGGGVLPGTAHIHVTRIWGTTAYTTAAKVAETPPASDVGSATFTGAYAGTNASGGTGRYNDTFGLGSSAPVSSAPLRTAIVAVGTGFQDAESASTLAYAERFPILLTAPSALSAQTADALSALGIQQVVVMGGPYAVSNGVVSSLEALGLSVLRIAGQTYSGTSVALADFETTAGAGLGWIGTGSVTVARGDGFTDGLAGAVVAADGPASAAPSPLLLTLGPTTVGTALTIFLQSAGRTGLGGAAVTHLTVLGGPFAISQSAINAMGAAL